MRSNFQPAVHIFTIHLLLLLLQVTVWYQFGFDKQLKWDRIFLCPLHLLLWLWLFTAHYSSKQYLPAYQSHNQSEGAISWGNKTKLPSDRWRWRRLRQTSRRRPQWPARYRSVSKQSKHCSRNELLSDDDDGIVIVGYNLLQLSCLYVCINRIIGQTKDEKHSRPLCGSYWSS